MVYPDCDNKPYRQHLVKYRFFMSFGEKLRKHLLSFYQPTWSAQG